MACTTCKCNVGLKNTGTGCTPIIDVARKAILVPIYDGDQVRNGILLSDTLNQAYFDALINQADTTKRWFPLPDMKNVTNERGENIVETFDDQTTAFLQEGGKAFRGWMVGAAPRLKEKIEAARCVEVGVYIVDKNGNLIGEISADGTTLYPIKLDKESVAAKFIHKTDRAMQKIEVSWNFDVEAKDENLAMITCDELSPVEPLQFRGLLDVCAEYSGIDNDEFTVTLKTEYGTPLNPVLDKGLVAADFTLHNVTDDLAVTIISATESPDGVYLITFAAQTNGDELRLTPSKDGRDYTCVVEDLIPMPLT